MGVRTAIRLTKHELEREMWREVAESEHSMMRCLLFALPVQTAAEIDGAGHVQHTVVKKDLCAPGRRHMGGKKEK